MFDVPGANVTAVYITEETVKGTKKAEYVTGPLETTEVADPDLSEEEMMDDKTMSSSAC